MAFRLWAVLIRHALEPPATHISMDSENLLYFHFNTVSNTFQAFRWKNQTSDYYFTFHEFSTWH